MAPRILFRATWLALALAAAPAAAAPAAAAEPRPLHQALAAPEPALKQAVVAQRSTEPGAEPTATSVAGAALLRSPRRSTEPAAEPAAAPAADEPPKVWAFALAVLALALWVGARVRRSD